MLEKDVFVLSRAWDKEIEPISDILKTPYKL